MKYHICTHNPCPLQEEEMKKIFELKLGTNYTNMTEPATHSGLAPLDLEEKQNAFMRE